MRDKPNKYLWIASTICAAAALCGCRSKPAEEGGEKAEAAEPVAVQTAAATVRSVSDVVVAQGTLAAGQGASVKIAPVVAGRLLEVRVKEGDLVTAGQVVAVLDTQIQRAQARSAAAAASTADAQAHQAELAATATKADVRSGVQVAQLGLRAATIDRDNGVQAAETALRASETDLAKTRAGARPQEIAQAEQQVRQARATLDRANAELARQQFLVEKGISAQRQLEDAKTAETVAAAALEGARQNSSLVRAGARAEDLRAAELRVQQAKDSLAMARTSGEAKVAQAQGLLHAAETAALQQGVKEQEARAALQAAAQKRADLAAAQSTVGFAELRSPIGGTVIRRAQNPGDMADPASAVVEVSDVHALNLNATLPVDQGNKIRTGMSARVRFGGASGSKAATGRVISVGPADPQTNLLAVRIGLTGGITGAPVGSFASAEIVVQTLPAAIVVPRIALLTRDSGPVVFVVGADGTARQTKVKLGIEPEPGTRGGDDVVQVVSGVKPGDQVITLGHHELPDGAKVKRAEPEEKGKDAEAGEKGVVSKPESGGGSPEPKKP